MAKYYDTPYDYRVKYSGCYVRLNALPPNAPLGAARVVRIEDTFEVSEVGELKKVHCTFFSKTGDNLTKRKQDWVAIKYLDWKPIRMGVFNMAKSCLVIRSKVPDGNAKYRQFPHPHSIVMLDPFAQERSFLGARKPSKIDDYFILDGWGNENYFNAPDALAMVMNHERLGAAFSKHWFFGISYAGDGIFLYRDGLRVARVNTQGEVVLKPQVHCLAELLTEYGLTVKKVDK